MFGSERLVLLWSSSEWLLTVGAGVLGQGAGTMSHASLCLVIMSRMSWCCQDIDEFESIKQEARNKHD